jgi:hypothetical protein
MVGTEEKRRIFRPRCVLGALMGAAGALWLGVLIYLLQFQGVPPKTLLFTMFFVVFFAVSVAYYVRTAVFVDSKGVTFRGLVRTQRFQFSDIRKVDILPGPVTVYSVRANGRFGHFTSFFKHHRMLLELLVERAGLAPRRAGFL